QFLAAVNPAGVLLIRSSSDLRAVLSASIAAEWCGPLLAGDDAKSWIIAGKDGRGRIVDAATGPAARPIEAHAGPITLLLMTPDRDRLITANVDPDNQFKIWDWPSGVLHCEIADAGRPATAAISPDGRRLVAGGWELVVRLWAIDSGERMMNVARAS